jgi:hypothetical protein
VNTLEQDLDGRFSTFGEEEEQEEQEGEESGISDGDGGDDGDEYYQEDYHEDRPIGVSSCRSGRRSHDSRHSLASTYVQGYGRGRWVVAIRSKHTAR